MLKFEVCGASESVELVGYIEVFLYFCALVITSDLN